MKIRIVTLLWAATLLLLVTSPAKAQMECSPGNLYAYSGDLSQAGFIPLLGTSPAYGFDAWSCPAPDAWVPQEISMWWNWLSTCASGGNYYNLVTHAGPSQTPWQINVNSTLSNPFTNGVQGTLSGFAYAAATTPPGPQWRYTSNSGGPCGPID